MMILSNALNTIRHNNSHADQNDRNQALVKPASQARVCLKNYGVEP